jgi:hypothetical protein
LHKNIGAEAQDRMTETSQTACETEYDEPNAYIDTLPYDASSDIKTFRTTTKYVRMPVWPSTKFPQIASAEPLHQQQH